VILWLANQTYTDVDGRRGKAMGSDDERQKLLHEIGAWRDARNAHPPGSPQNKEFQRKMKEAEWKLHGLGPPEDSPPGLLIKIVSPEKPQE
jgi:hypothetical protein